MAQQSARQALSHRLRVTISLLIVLAAALSTRAFSAAPAHAASYNCSHNCTSVQYWAGPSYGAFTQLSTAQLTCTTSGCWNGSQIGFIEYGQWLYDTHGHNGACVDNATSSDICWIEEGYSTLAHNGGIISEYYFWADNRPGQNCIPPFCSGSYNEHYMGSVPSSDYGVYHPYTIARQSDHSQWLVSGPGFTNYSTSNPIDPDRMYMGAELFGPNYATSGAYGGYADFTQNRYNDSGGTSHWEGCGGAGSGLQSLSGAPPPYVQYVRSPCGSSDGGDIKVWCCNASGPGYAPVNNGTNAAPPTSMPAKARSMGIAAITPHPSSSGTVAAFTAADVVQYGRAHGLPHAAGAEQMSVTSVKFMTSAAASAMLAGESTGLDATAPVAVAEIHGTFTFTSPLTQGTAQRAFEVFDGATGNLLMLSIPG